MAAPATVALAVKAAITAATDKRTRNAVCILVAALVTPLILIIVMIVSLLSAAADHNNTAIDLCFNGGAISSQAPADYAAHIRDMRGSFSELDAAITDISAELEDGSLDSIRIKAIFYALLFGAENLRMDNSGYQAFVKCFVGYETRTRTVDHGDGTTSEETRTVAVPIKSLPEIYDNLENTLGRTITLEDQANAAEIYYRILYGGSVPTYGKAFDQWANGLPLSDAPFVGADGFCSPLGENWRGVVTSEFGYRTDPFTGESRGHTGLDLGAPSGTPIRAALDGTVQFVRYTNTGYGYHLAIDHGGGFVTLYGHCSKILIAEGQTVKAGDIIAQVGSTGRSTGPHLHFEVRINGEMKNPRSYLP
ncbi:Duplicated hybrid motif [Syntrophomonas zehnderi OL-4]|uniref:Duplicated hybrid motif n=1 Tax=Syntrophomonas zehnderi OL-4 TaxID=690567 RepID=A0A0E4C9A8_9FIRM|nr:M23 family metallopeptidase [Syntrophomonas zehnderi]CFX91625.1 Duplicated hybrid motif [Syntrophomonas zehnderi OL-4]